jgi:hypothetical protein
VIIVGFEAIAGAKIVQYWIPNAREMRGFGLSWACSPAVTLSEVGLVGGPAVIGRARRGVPGMGGGSR